MTAMTPTLDLHKQYLAKNAAAIQAACASTDAATQYNASYYTHGIASAFEATADPDLGKTLAGYLDAQVAAATAQASFGSATCKTWGPLDGQGKPVQLNVYQGLGPIARGAALFKASDPARAKVYADFARSNLMFWHDRATGVYATQGPWPYAAGPIPWLPTDLGGWGTYPTWIDVASLMAAAACWLVQYDPADDACRDLATRAALGFRRKLCLWNGGFIWDRGIPQPDTRSKWGAPDTSHANREPMWLTAAVGAGIEFTRADLVLMANTVTGTLWNGRVGDPAFANYLDGANGPFGTQGPYGVGLLYLGWALVMRTTPLGRYVLADVLDRVGKGPGGMLGPDNFSPYAQVAYSGHALLA